MDPNATLKALDENLAEAGDGNSDYETRAELYAALQSWLDRGGFQPDWHKYLRATAYYLGRRQAEQTIHPVPTAEEMAEYRKAKEAMGK